MQYNVKLKLDRKINQTKLFANNLFANLSWANISLATWGNTTG